MQITTTTSGDQANITLAGRFQFNTHREFRDAYEPFVGHPAVSRIVLDFAGVEYLDSAALGMLLLLREKLLDARKSIEITGSQGLVRQVLDIANFSRLFPIS